MVKFIVLGNLFIFSVWFPRKYTQFNFLSLFSVSHQFAKFPHKKLFNFQCCCHGNDGSTTETGGIEENSSSLDHHHHHDDHTDPSVMVFFTLKDLKIGKRMPVHFPKRDPSKSPKLWPREEADSVPFSLNHLPHLLKLFSLSANSPQATAMEDTLKECESKPIKGEVKFCATSLESMLDFTQRMLGPGSDIQVMQDEKTNNFNYFVMLYTIWDNYRLIN